MRIAVLSTTTLAAALLLTGCDDMSGFSGVTEDFHSSYNMGPGGRLDLTNRNGSLEITGWDRNTVDVSGTKYAPDHEGLKDVRVDIHQSGDSLSIRTETPRENWHGGGYGVRYRIHVPRRFLLDRLETTNGSVTAEDLEGGGRIKSTNGKLSLTRLNGDYNVVTTNGSIEVEECAGIQKMETTNGAVRGRLKEGIVEAHTTNGTIDLTVAKPSNERPVKLSTTNGSVTLALAEFHANPVQVETTHGGVTLRLPPDTNGQLEAETSLANVTSDLPLTSTDEKSKHELRGRLGSGGPSIRAHTTTGAIRIERY